jgi:hypothetical protein
MKIAVLLGKDFSVYEKRAIGTAKRILKNAVKCKLPEYC